MREIVLDTETTGLDPLRGDRLVEIGCVEIVNRFLTGRVYHQYINPQRSMPIGHPRRRNSRASFWRAFMLRKKRARTANSAPISPAQSPPARQRP